ncbi:aminopeptidase [Fulvivirga sedimenti]|uniref:Aminopeptidase n=1 Tax=Fulvivirga sedimenti TaxID=2879465 RepID=A0A9X1KUU6_9BACT|nr:aminopeptidase [Fulvivirga sedimenti]MCA6073953.1 aminopeptidase [Fulvivirga sedimenti]
MFKKTALILLLILLVVAAWNYKLIRYGLQQGRGQLSIVWNARDVNEVMNDPQVPDSVKTKLSYISVVRQYAIDSLGLNDTDNYTTLYDQKGKPVLWVVTGTKPFAFEPYEWDFPVVGTVPYKGFFREELATREMEAVSAKGFDAGVRTVGGWSTLGWFRDPILSEMLTRSDGDLANLIIHELVHSTIFVKDSVTFNENLASFIADKGTVLFLKSHFGDSSVQVLNYYRELGDEKKFADHILLGADKLDSLYSNLSNLDSASLAVKKTNLIRKVVESVDTLQLTFNYDIRSRLEAQFPNNTYFMSFIRYRERQQDLDSLFFSRYEGNLRFMISEFIKTYPYL